MQQARAELLLQRPQDASASAAHALDDGADCHREIIRDVTVALAQLVHGRALAATGDTAGAEAAYAKASVQNAPVHADDPLSWPLYLTESMRLASALGHTDAAARDAHLLLAALDRAEAPATHPWRLEAQLSLASWSSGNGDIAAMGGPVFDAALGRIRTWPVGARLAQWRASMHGRP
jgi:hypothetical protein